MILAKIPATNDSEWHSIDQEEFFYKNLETAPPDWIYRSKDVYYRFNSNGYRCPEWESVDWSNSVVILGCSYVAGVGLAEEDTLSSALSSIVKSPVINLGVASSSNQLILHNSLSLISAGIRPKAVVTVFTDTARLTFFKEDGSARHLGHWILPGSFHRANNISMQHYSDEYVTFYKQWVNGGNADIHGQNTVSSIENAWRAHNVPFYGFSAYEGQLSSSYPKLVTMVDKARDFRHPGILTVKLWAKLISDKISQNG